MDRDQWKAANEIFHAALEIPEGEREQFVSSRSQGDLELESSVRRLLRADAQAENYLDTSALAKLASESLDQTSPPFTSGDILKGRFRILRHVGQGGMGDVFEAFDEELDVRVALKAIRAEISSNKEALEMFRREVRTARSITHPNICRTFDLDRGPVSKGNRLGEEFWFLTMEFLEGETLAARISRSGPLHLDEASSVARQIVSGLDAAHRMGVIHRDIKPGNIMLSLSRWDESGPRAVIMDFGLARHNPVSSDISPETISHGNVIGTLAYMAPEQMEPGNKATLASDVYALGLVLFEMVTGHRAFPSSDLFRGIAQRMRGPVPSPRDFALDLPDSWQGAIQHCLELDPAKRPRTGGEVIDELEGNSVDRLPHKNNRFARLLGQRQIQVASALLVFLLAAVSLLTWFFRIQHQSQNAAVSPGALVYLTEVKNLTGESAFDHVTELLRAGLSQSSQVNLLNEGRVSDTLQLMTKGPESAVDASTAREIAMRTGAVRVVFASIERSGKDYQLDIDLEQPAGEPSRFRDQWRKTFAWTSERPMHSSAAIPPELLRSFHKASDWIRYEIGESRNDIARLDTPPEDVTTGSWAALEALTEAKGLYQAGKREDAVQRLQTAIDADVHCALAYGMLGDVLYSLHRQVEGDQAYQQSLEEGAHGRLTKREQDRIRGMRATDSEDYELAVQSFRDLAANYPQDPAGWLYPTIPLRMLGRDEEAVRNLQHAIDLDPNGSFAPYALAQESMILGRMDDAEHWISYLRDHHHLDSAAETAGYLRMLQHRYAEAEAQFRSMENSENKIRRSYSYQLLAELYAETDRPQEAIQILSAGINEDRSQNNRDLEAIKLVGRAYLRASLHQYQASIDDEHVGYTLSPTPERALAADTVLGTLVATATSSYRVPLRREFELIRSSQKGQSGGTLSELVQLRTAGELQLLNQHPAEASDTMARASVKDAARANKEYLLRAELALQQVNSRKVPREITQYQLRTCTKEYLLAEMTELYAIPQLPGLAKRTEFWCKRERDHSNHAQSSR